jgi:hypothetical protein
MRDVIPRLLLAIEDEEKKRSLITLLEGNTILDAQSQGALRAEARRLGFERIVKLWSSLGGIRPAPNNLIAWAAARSRPAATLRQRRQEA